MEDRDSLAGHRRISFASQNHVRTIEGNVRFLKDNQGQSYGGLNIIYCGDFRQLESCNESETRIYESFLHQFEGLINCYIELNSLHRFKDDPVWGVLLRRFRNGKLTEVDIDAINTRVIGPRLPIPPGTQYATFRNKDRVASTTLSSS